MVSLITSLHFNFFSFIFGFFFALLTVWVFLRLRNSWPQAKGFFKDLWQKSNSQAQYDVRHRLTREILKRVQSNHLASPYFSLDEIIIPPRFVLPLPFTDPDDLISFEDSIHPIVPYTPDWPELTSHLNVPSISLIDALQGNTHVAIIGQPGSGKTTALCWLASQLQVVR